LLAGGKIQTYFNGQKETSIELTLAESIANKAKLYTAGQVKNLYVFDPGNKRVIVVEKNGKNQKQYKIETNEEILSFAVSWPTS